LKVDGYFEDLYLALIWELKKSMLICDFISDASRVFGSKTI
jgi:hypothetical protein